MRVLVTGGLGFIGSHTVVSLISNGYDVVIVDDLSNSKLSVLDRLKAITGKSIDFEQINLLDYDALDKVFSQYNIDFVIHFAAFKAVGESQEKPLEYYQNNLVSLINVLNCMRNHSVYRIVFSSSACVYGTPDSCPIPETAEIRPQNVYGRTKAICENILQDTSEAIPEFSIALLRYFNPIGAHESGLIGEDPNGIPNNLMPYITQVAAGRRDILTVYGNDYPTEDGTGVRDYIHVCDLAEGHVAVLNKLKDNTGVFIYNLGCGRGYSVLEVIHAFEEVNHVKVNHVIGPRRSGDSAVCFSNPEKANKELGWYAKHDIRDMCRDSWRWECYARDHEV